MSRRQEQHYMCPGHGQWQEEDVIEDATAQRFEPLYTYGDVAQIFKVEPQTVMEWVRRGSFPSPVYIEGTARFTHTAIEEVLHKGRKPDKTYPVAESPRSKARQKPAKKPAKKKGAKKR